MSESQLEILQRIKAEAIEARQHPCGRCGHAGSEHVFDFVSGNIENPCLASCMICMGIK